MSQRIPPVEIPRQYSPSEQENERAAKIVKALNGLAMENFGKNDQIVLTAETLEELKQAMDIPEDTTWEEFKREADELFRTHHFFRIAESRENNILLNRKFNQDTSSRVK